MLNSMRLHHFLWIIFSLLMVACGGGGGGSTAGESGGPVSALPPSITVVADATAGGGTRVTAQFNGLAGVATDGSGNVYVADTNNHVIRKINSNGLVSTLAGSAGIAGFANGTGSTARFYSPNALVAGSDGTVYVADTNNHTIRKITAAGVVTTMAGSAGSAGSLDATGTSATFKSPYGLALDAAGNIYVADTGNHVIRKITPAGVVTTVAGTAGSSGSTDATGSSARFKSPLGVASDAAGTLYVADTGNHVIRKISSGGVVETLAGTAGSSGSTDDTGASARFSSPYSVSVDGSNTVYVADTGNNTIRKITSGGVVSTLAGMVGSNGAADGVGTMAGFSSPNAVAVGSGGTVYVADTQNHVVRKIVVSTKAVTTYAGVSGIPGEVDGAVRPAKFHAPQSALLDAAGNLFVSDTDDSVVRKVTASGVVSVWTGLQGVSGSAEGSTATAQFNTPGAMALAASNTLVLADTGNHIIRKISSLPTVATFAGTAEQSGSKDGSGTSNILTAAQFSSPSAVAVGSDGTIYVTDTDNNTIRKITTAGVVTTLAGSADDSGSDNGACLAARFYAPKGIAVDSRDNLYVADTGNNTIRKIVRGADCQVTTLAGSPDEAGSQNGAGMVARFDEPRSLAVDANGIVYVADFNNGIRKITVSGSVSTLIALQDADDNMIVPNPTGISLSGNTVVITAGNLVFLYQ